MSGSILEVLETIREAVPSSLIGEEGYARLAAVARLLPSDLTTYWGLECRLGHAEAMADILFETSAHSSGQRLLAGLVPSSLDALCGSGEIWPGLRRFAGLWTEPAHAFHTRIRNIWLELDTAGSLSGHEGSQGMWEPSFFFGPTLAGKDTKEWIHALTLDVLTALGRAGTMPDCFSQLVTSLPAHVGLTQVGAMLSRPGAGLRVVLDNIEPRDVRDWLCRTSWKGDPQSIFDLMEEVAPMLGGMALDLDLDGNGISAKVGIECYQQRSIKQEPSLWVPLLDFLQERGLCLAAKREGLLAFPGISRSALKKRISSDGIVFTDVFRSIHHIKLNVAAGRFTEAKAYLAVSRPGIRPGAMLGKLARSARSKDQPSSQAPWIVH